MSSEHTLIIEMSNQLSLLKFTFRSFRSAEPQNTLHSPVSPSVMAVCQLPQTSRLVLCQPHHLLVILHSPQLVGLLELCSHQPNSQVRRGHSIQHGINSGYGWNMLLAKMLHFVTRVICFLLL